MPEPMTDERLSELIGIAYASAPKLIELVREVERLREENATLLSELEDLRANKTYADGDHLEANYNRFMRNTGQKNSLSG